MKVRTDQLLCMAKATGSRIYTRELEVKSHGRTRILVLLLKQYHVHYYQFYEKGTTRAMVSLQVLHTSNTFQCFNMPASVGLKSFCPWCFRLGGNTETIATHLREVHYQLAITCDISKVFASMSAQIILDHHSGCKVKSHKKKSKVRMQEKASQSQFEWHWWILQGEKTPKTFCPIPLMNMGCSSHLNLTFWVSFHSTIQTIMFCYS